MSSNNNNINLMEPRPLTRTFTVNYTNFLNTTNAPVRPQPPQQPETKKTESKHKQ